MAQVRLELVSEVSGSKMQVLDIEAADAFCWGVNLGLRHHIHERVYLGAYLGYKNIKTEEFWSFSFDDLNDVQSSISIGSKLERNLINLDLISGVYIYKKAIFVELGVKYFVNVTNALEGTKTNYLNNQLISISNLADLDYGQSSGFGGLAKIGGEIILNENSRITLRLGGQIQQQTSIGFDSKLKYGMKPKPSYEIGYLYTIKNKK